MNLSCVKSSAKLYFCNDVMGR